MLFWEYGIGREGQFYVYSTFITYLKTEISIKGLKGIEAYEKMYIILRMYL